jgi:hypothetical protein
MILLSRSSPLSLLTRLRDAEWRALYSSPFFHSDKDLYHLKAPGCR